MKNLFKFCLVALFATISLSSCHFICCDADEEAVCVEKPWLWGHGGVQSKAVTTGNSWAWLTTKAVYFKTTPQRYDEAFDDIFSNNNTPLDFHSYITIQIVMGKSPILLQNYGEKWYENNIQVPYRNFTREEVSKYSPFDLVSNREVLNRIDSTVTAKMLSYVDRLSKDKEFPITIKQIVTGAAKPNQDQLAEMNRTAALIQKKESEQRNKEMELIRAEAEQARANADKAYMNSMNLSADQFIQLKYIEMIASKDGANIDVMVGPATSMWNIRR